MKKLLLTLCLSSAWLAAAAQTSDFPSKPVTFLVPYSTGTGADLMARLLGPRLAAMWKVPVITENKVGASGAIGTEVASKAAPNGQTFFITATAHGTVPAMRPKLPFDPHAFVPVVLLGTSALTLDVSGKSSMQTFQDFVSAVKKSPGEVTYSSPGTGSPQHLAMELLSQEAGIKLLHVPYKGTAGALTDLMGGHVQASVVALQTAASHVQGGAMRMLAVMSAERSPAFPNVPTMRELGLPGVVVNTWYGVLAPAGTPADMVRRVNADINTLLQTKEVQDAMARQGLTVAGGDPQRMGALAESELARWARVVKAAGLQSSK